jgi:hypothetical protein
MGAGLSGLARLEQDMGGWISILEISILQSTAGWLAVVIFHWWSRRRRFFVQTDGSGSRSDHAPAGSILAV